ncbi:MAG: thiol:disulfide interchange protein tlpA [Rickettsiaceae bacterium]|jgi:thiol-disulfide isomerase/thioredoxin|nr:thiol:disulfide interchange protein tlpA [Rickettsiaceae bacterium]
MSKLIILFLLGSLIGISHASPYDSAATEGQNLVQSTEKLDSYKPFAFIDKYLNSSTDGEYSKISHKQVCTHIDKHFYNASSEQVVKEVKIDDKFLNENEAEEKPKSSNKNHKEASSKAIAKPYWKIKYLNNLYVPEDIAVYDKDGKEHYFDEFDNKTLLIIFWATWSSSSLQDMPALDDFKKDFRKLPFEIIPISVDYQDPKIIYDFFQKNNIRHLVGYHDKNNKLFKELSVIGLPTAFLVSTEGEILLSLQGPINWYDDEVRELIMSNIKVDAPLPKNSYQDKSLNYSVRAIDNKNKKPNTIGVKTTQEIEKENLNKAPLDKQGIQNNNEARENNDSKHKNQKNN